MPGFFSHIRYRVKRCSHRLRLFTSQFERPINAVTTGFDIASGIAAIACMVALIVYVGYNLHAADRKLVFATLRASQAIFATAFFFNIFFRLKDVIRHTTLIKWISDAGLLLTVAAWCYPEPSKPWIAWLANVVYSNKFLFGVLALYSLVNICHSISKIPGRRTNPSVIMACSFLFFIIIGSFVLMLPRCTYHGISYFDSLFVSSSAVCITGLSPVDIPSTFTPLGLLALSVLVQLGSLGVITFTSFFAIFFTGTTSIYNQLLLRDMIYSKSMNALIPTLLYVLGFTITIEVLGAVAVYFTTPGSLELDGSDRLMFAAFHSMSSFCNAGFSCIPDGMANHAIMASGTSLYIVTSVLIFAGAVGFPILVNLRDILFFYVRKAYRKIIGAHAEIMRVHVFDLNTKLVLYTTIIILCVSSAAFFLLEYHNTLQNLSLSDKIVQSVFNSLIPRSAGFASLNPNHFLNVTILLILLQMAIGGSSQSMAGGVKVNAVAAVCLNLRSVVRGHNGTTAFGRTINYMSIRRANAVITLSIAALTIYTTAIMILEPQLSAKSAIFEVVSALFTVGSSLGATSHLSDVSKVILCTAMFFGRVGLLSILCGTLSKPRDVAPHLPVDNIIIN